MTKIGVIKGFVGSVVDRLKKKMLILMADDFKKPKYEYPLYWLAPTIDRGLKNISVGSIFKETFNHNSESNLFHYPGTPKHLKFVLSILGLDPCKRKEPLVRVARIDGQYMVEQGQKWVRLAAFLNLCYIPVRVVEYDYASLKKRMHILKQPNGALVGVTAGQKGNCNYYGIFPAQLDVLVRSHRIPGEDLSAVTMQKSAVVGMGRMPASEGKAAKNRSNLVLIKK